jgi:hypothetical protein
MDMNTTYTRNYIRSYARAIGVGEAKIIRALDRVQQNNYNGELLGREQASSDSEDDISDDSDGQSADASQQQEEAENEQEAEDEQDDKASMEEGRAASLPENRSRGEWDWVEVGRKAPASRNGAQEKTLSMIILLIVLLAAAFLVYYFLYSAGSSSNVQSSADNMGQPAAPPNTSPGMPGESGAANDSTAHQSGQAFASLPDTLMLTVYAANGRLNPVRVYTDLAGKYDPYWVKQGDSLQVRFRDTVGIQAVNQYDHLQLRFEGHLISDVYEKYYVKNAKAIKLTRSIFEKHPEWERSGQ